MRCAAKSARRLLGIATARTGINSVAAARIFAAGHAKSLKGGSVRMVGVATLSARAAAENRAADHPESRVAEAAVAAARVTESGMTPACQMEGAANLPCGILWDESAIGRFQ